jgi:hypothetical protein
MSRNSTNSEDIERYDVLRELTVGQSGGWK